jgi:serine-type D-Ala-D-Ala carboxypeptidase/endopeptidase (penicillin-binding protein 4)
MDCVPFGRRQLLKGAVALFSLLAMSVPTLNAQDAPDRLAGKFLDLVKDQGLTPDQVALVVVSVHHRALLVQHRAGELMPAASNTKLVTAYAALRALSPNFRWRTRISKILDHDGAGDIGRQEPFGLLIEGSGDPTITFVTLETWAQRLRAAGIRKISGALVLDESDFGTSAPANAEPATDLTPSDVPDEPDGAANLDDTSVLTPPRAFIVERNAPEFIVSLADAGGIPEVQGPFPTEAARIVNKLQSSQTSRSLLRVQQDIDDAHAVLTFGGTVAIGVHSLNVPIEDPTALFAQALRAALHRQGIEGALPLKHQVSEGAKRVLLFSHYSPPLREAIGPILKDSDNVAADSLIWTLAGQGRQGGRQGPPDLQDGIRWVGRILQQDFPGIQNEVEIADGSGLNADSRFSARALVRVLTAAVSRPEFGPEFESALSRAGWDGTLHYRNYSPALQGRLRAKTGTLVGVSNLTGVLPLAQDEVIFSFLVSAPGQSRTALQTAQDKIVTSLYTLLRKEEILSADSDPLAPRVLEPPPASAKPGRKKGLKPPPSSPKPKAGGSAGQTGVG